MLKKRVERVLHCYLLLAKISSTCDLFPVSLFDIKHLFYLKCNYAMQNNHFYLKDELFKNETMAVWNVCVALHSAYGFTILFIKIGSLYTLGLSSTDTLHSWKSLCMIIMLWHHTQTLTYWRATFTFPCTHTRRASGLLSGSMTWHILPVSCICWG